MKFDFIIGNPPYQDDIVTKGDRPNPIYNRFMDESYKISDVVELIHPARFLSEAGQTPKEWNRKMLHDEHFKVLYYEPDGKKIFPETDIKGGVAITIRNAHEFYGEIGTFTSFDTLNSIIRKIGKKNEKQLKTIIASQGLFRFSEAFFKENSEAISLIGKGTGAKIVSSILEKLPSVFLDTPTQTEEYVRFLGRINNQRIYKYIKRKYLTENSFIDSYKLFIPEANNKGTYGETLTEPMIGLPLDGSSDTFLNAGPFKSEIEAKNLAIYIKTKFFRALLGVKKVTQHCPPVVWELIPLQDFTEHSDIDWTKSVAEIDKQLYAKYGLDETEINFIETHVKEMQ
mgnify:FL=1